MRRFVCDACGKSIEINWCANQHDRDLRCPDCSGRMYRGHGVGTRQGYKQGGGNILTAGINNMNDAGTVGNGFGFRQKRAKNGSGRCLGSGNGLNGRRSG